MEWYYVKDGASCGPVETAELVRLSQTGRLKPDDLVWNASMGDTWAKASTVKELDAAGARVMPPLSMRAASATGRIALTDPVRNAWMGMKLILFQPFDIAKWFAIGFSAWLATLGEGGGGGSFNPGGRGMGSGGGSGGSRDFSVDGLLTSAEEAWVPVREFFQNYGWIFVGVAAILLVVGVAAGVVFLWLRCRGRFMLLDNVLKNRGEVSEPWRTWRQHGHSLFLWSLAYGVICLAIFLVIVGLSWPLVIQPCVAARAFVSATIGGMVTLGLLLLLFAFVTYYIGIFLEDFIVPLMYRHDLTAAEAWRKFLPLYHANSGRFFLYGLFRLLLQACAGMATLALILVTCLIAGCLMAIPYIGAVVLLPVTVFFRLYGVEYLAQYGGDFVVGAGEE